MTHAPETGAINRLHFLAPEIGARKWSRFMAPVSGACIMGLSAVFPADVLTETRSG